MTRHAWRPINWNEPPAPRMPAHSRAGGTAPPALDSPGASSPPGRVTPGGSAPEGVALGAGSPPGGSAPEGLALGTGSPSGSAAPGVLPDPVAAAGIAAAGGAYPGISQMVPGGPGAIAARSRALPAATAGPSVAHQRLSLTRVLLAVVIVAAIVLGSGYGVRSAIDDRGVSGLSPTWFAPYIDVTLTPTYQFQVPSNEPAHQVVLGFVVADPHAACTPSWGGYDTLGQAAAGLSLDARLAQLRQEGVGAVISFGGQAGNDLAVTCQDPSRLVAAYTSVIDRYRSNTIDLDVEGAALTDFAAVKRRAAAMHALQLAAHRQHKELAIWLTLPVERSGLNAAGLSVVTQMLRDRVQLAGVDVLAMDYGPPVADMGSAAEQALTATHAQLSQLYARYGIHLSSAALWHTIGVTVMIGQNDDTGEQFTLADAGELEGFARSEHLGRVSIWSLNRDSECGSDFGEIGVLSNTCSGVAQGSLAFDAELAKLSGSASAVAGLLTPVGATGAQLSQADSPYPIWQPGDPYVEGYKVVWQSDVYEAKWYNQGDDPAADVQYAWQTPWLLIGPVLPGEHAPTTTTLPPGSYPVWSPSGTYKAGAKVLFGGLPYQAKWYNQGDSPAAQAGDPTGSPWQALYHVPGEPTGSQGG